MPLDTRDEQTFWSREEAGRRRQRRGIDAPGDPLHRGIGVVALHAEEVLATPGLAGDVIAEIRQMQTDHQMYDDYVQQTLDFLENE
ncbi:MAG: hypothetical protein AAF211_09355 [Myxococcota bacterium]